MKKYSAPAFIFLICSIYSTTSKAQLKADFTISKLTGCSPLAENFIDATTGGTKPYTYIWDFGDGDSSKSASPGHTYGSVYSSTIYKVTLIVRDANNNTSSSIKSVAVLPTPRPDLGPDQRGCWGNPVVLSTGLPHEPIVNWTWIQGTDTVKNVLHGDTVYIKDSGTYVVKVLNSYGCAGYDTAIIHFNPLVKANRVDSTVCYGDLVTLSAGSGGYGGSGVGYTIFDKIHGNKIVGTSSTFKFLATSTTGYGKSADFGIVIKQTFHGVTCADTGYYNITVNTPTHPLLYKILSKCISDPAFQLYTGPPYIDPGHQGGIWFYPKNPSAIQNNFLYPAVMGITAKDTALGWIHYIYYNQYNCRTEDSIRFFIFGLPTVSAGPDTLICSKHGKYLLSNTLVSPKGGLWVAGTGTPSSAVSYSPSHDSAFFDPGAGGIIDTVYGVIYSYKDALPGGCINSDTVFIKVTNSCNSGINTLNDKAFNLSIYPNPFSSSATLQYSLIKPSTVRISLLDVTGKEIAEIKNENQVSGSYQFEIDGEKYHLSPGVYLLKFMTDDGYVSRQVVKL